MSKFLINGGSSLTGEISVGGAKNNAQIMLPVAILSTTPIKITNLPMIDGVEKSLELLDRIAELKVLQSQGEMRAPQIKMDTKDFGIGAQILHDLDITKIELLSNSTAPTKRVGMIGYGLEITDYVNY